MHRQLRKTIVVVLLWAVMFVGMPVPFATANTVHMANHVVISEIQIDSIAGSGGTGDDWIELYNPTSSDINLSAEGYRLEKDADGGDNNPGILMRIGDTVTDGSYPGGTIIPSHGFYLIVRDDANETLRNKADAIGARSEFDLTDDDVIYLGTGAIDGPTDGDIVDFVGYGSPGLDTAEGRHPASQPSDGGSIERKAIYGSTADDMGTGGDHYYWGNGEDTDNNSTDFVTKTTPEPQNSSSSTEDCPAQNWYLSNVSDGSYVMYKEDMSKGEGEVTINAGSSEIWKADQEAIVDVAFPNNSWTGQITFTSAPASGHNFIIQAGYYDSSFHSGGLEATLEGNSSKTVFDYTANANSFTVNDGDYLAFRITNSSDTNYVVKTGQNYSYLTSPETDPGYPVPELRTIVLLFLGLLFLGGYTWIRRTPLEAIHGSLITFAFGEGGTISNGQHEDA